jgi:hypothetical protein
MADPIASLSQDDELELRDAWHGPPPAQESR